MGAGHTHALYVHEHSPLHSTAPEVKVVAAFGLVLAAAITPAQAVWSYAIFGAMAAIAIAIARLPLRFVLIRMAGVLPFIGIAAVIPFVSTGEQIEVMGVSMSQEGLWAAWGIFAKASLGVAVSVTLAGTTEVADMLRGMNRLRVPAALTAIAGFMVRYIEVVAGEISRMRIAMTARGYDPRWLAQTRPIASAAGTLFVRSYERGERIHSAMVSRGYTGTMPDLGHQLATRAEWLRCSVWVALAAATAVAARVVT